MKSQTIMAGRQIGGEGGSRLCRLEEIVKYAIFFNDTVRHIVCV